MLKRVLPLALVVVAVVGACSSPAASPSRAAVPSATATPTAGPHLVSPSAVPGTSSTPTDATTTESPGSSSSEAPSPASALDPNDWPVYHLDAARTGNSATFPPVTAPLSLAWKANLDGAVYAEPIVVHSVLVVATEGDSVYSLEPSTGDVIWKTNVGTPVPLNALPCGNIDPLGITGTPAYDPTTNTIFAVAEVTGPHHVLFALDPDDGSVRWSRTVDLPGDDPRTHQQRSALAIANGYVYIGFGGLAGDCGQYTGKVVGVPVTGSGNTISYRVPVKREGAIWATGGPVVDANGNLYVSTGNGSSTTTYDGSDSIIELSPDLEQLSLFAPRTWAADNSRDADLGSLSPTLTPNGYVFIAGKSGTGYVARQGQLGGIGGQVSQQTLCRGFGGTSLDGNDVFVPCTTGTARVSILADGSMKVVWKASVAANGPPVIGGGAVWSVDTAKGVLYALDEATGKSVGSISIGAVPHFVSPTLWQGLVFVGTSHGVVAVNG
jgi:outer membrane protein assembly factor BamB